MDMWISLVVWSVLVSSVIHTSAGAAVGSELDTFYTDNSQYCSKWLKFNGTMANCNYECGSSLDGTIADSSSPIVLLHGCNYMTASANGNKTVVGASIYACSASFIPYRNCMNDVSCANFSSANEASLCSPLNRYSQLCSQCKPGYAPPVYSYSMACVKCNRSQYNWLKYIAVAFVPVTVFYLVIVTFQITVTSAPVNGLVLSSQIITSSFYARLFFTTYAQYSEKIDSAYFTLISYETVFSIWNLDFFRATYTPFCLTPSANILHILSLDYIIAAYPLVLILLTYILVKLHNRGNAIVTYAWMPFNHCFFRFRRYLGVNTSLVNVFATFLLVSYDKFISVSMDLLAPVNVYDIQGNYKTFVYLNASMTYCGKEHLPFVYLAISVLITFIIIPLILFLLYPFRCFHKLLNCCHLNTQSLHIFMDAYLGYFKDGTNGTRDCRFFAAMYFIVRVILATSVALIPPTMVPLVVCIIGLLFFCAITIIRPYKTYSDNIINSIAIMVLFQFVIVSLGIQMAPCLYPESIPDIYHLNVYATAVLAIFYIGTLLYIIRSFLRRQMLRVYKALTCCWLKTMQKLLSVVVKVEEVHSEYEELTAP